MCHFVGIVVQPDDGLPLLNAREDCHKCSVSHHQVQVVLGQVKVHRLTRKERKGKAFYSRAQTMFIKTKFTTTTATL